jgi:hypothetical protein
MSLTPDQVASALSEEIYRRSQNEVVSTTKRNGFGVCAVLGDEL